MPAHGEGPGGADDDIDPVAALYALPPGAFVAARNALAARLRADGERDRAAQVSRLRRPTVAAALLNRLARQRPEVIGQLTAAGDAVRRAQRRALSGVKDDALREATRRLNGAISDGVDAVAALADRTLTASLADQLSGALRGAAIDPDRAAALRRGTLSSAEAAAADPIAGLLASAPLVLVGQDEEADPAADGPVPPDDADGEPEAADAARRRRVALLAQAAAARAVHAAALQQHAEHRQQLSVANAGAKAARDDLAAARHALADAESLLEAAQQQVNRCRRRVSARTEAAEAASFEVTRITTRLERTAAEAAAALAELEAAERAAAGAQDETEVEA